MAQLKLQTCQALAEQMPLYLRAVLLQVRHHANSPTPRQSRSSVLLKIAAERQYSPDRLRDLESNACHRVGGSDAMDVRRASSHRSYVDTPSYISLAGAAGTSPSLARVTSTRRPNSL